MTTTETVMTDPTTAEGREYWADRQQYEAEREKAPESDLEKLIADSMAERDRRIAEEEAARKTEEARYDALFQSLLTESIEAVKTQIPLALHPHVQYEGGRPSKEALDARSWRPTALVVTTPGLAAIIILFNWMDNERPELYSINSGSNFGPDDWAGAIASAFDRYHAQRAAFSQAVAGL